MSAINRACETIAIELGGEGDGRLISAIKETEYLDVLTNVLKDALPEIVIIRPAARGWYDIRINGVPINLKLLTGGTDNAMNKTAIIFTLTGTEQIRKNMNFNQFIAEIPPSRLKRTRNPLTEYHYLVIHKTSGRVLLKSILDIHSYKSNPCNYLQINWNAEFEHLDYTSDKLGISKSIELLSTIQKSVRDVITGMTLYANTDIHSLFS